MSVREFRTVLRQLDLGLGYVNVVALGGSAMDDR